MLARRSNSRSIASNSRCTLQQNANGRHKAVCWQDFNTGIVSSQRERERESWMPQCSNPTCLSMHWGEETKAAPRKFNICFCLTTSQPPRWEAASPWQGEAAWLEECRIRPGSSGRPHSTSLKHSWGCQHGVTKTESSVWSVGRAPCLNWTPSCFLTRVCVTSPLT